MLVNPVFTYLLHEFGHVVGLGHPDEAGQQVEAIMNADFGLFDNALFPDDIAGIQALYPHDAVGGGVLEIPAPGTLVSGIGFITGWKCEARRLTARINKGDPILLATGIPRTDTRSVCGDTTNGFITQVNWSWPHLGTGQHTVVVYDDGVEFARSTFTVGSTGEEFLKGVSVEIDVPDFPAPGETGRFVWSEATQHLELQDVRPAGRRRVDPEPPADQAKPPLEAILGDWRVDGAPDGPIWFEILWIEHGALDGIPQAYTKVRGPGAGLSGNTRMGMAVRQPSAADFPSMFAAGYDYDYVAAWGSDRWLYGFSLNEQGLLEGTFWRGEPSSTTAFRCRLAGRGYPAIGYPE